MEELILLVEDEKVARKNLEHILKREGYQVISVDSGAKALRVLENRTFDLVITDYKMSKVDGIQVLEKSRACQPHTEVILITGYATVNSAVKALKKGAYHYLAKPYKIDEVRRIVQEALLKRNLQLENIALKDSVGKSRTLSAIIGNSEPMITVKKTIQQIAPTDASVMILGESGTGKELVAQAIHHLSGRSKYQMVAFNCGSFSEELMANEFFGHEKEAFTGAGKTKKGLFETADKGTVFFDEIGDMPQAMQVKVLRVIQEKEFLRVGGTRTIPVDLRFIAATHRDLNHEVEKGHFRQDLFYRLNVVSIQLPPLSSRSGDIPLLAYHFLGKKNQTMGKDIKEIDPHAMDLICRYGWPGNVRELENVIEGAVVMTNGETIFPEALPDYITNMSVETYRADYTDTIPTLEDQEKNYIQWILNKTGWNKTQAAKLMGIDRVSLWRKIKRFHLE
ncbi:MAG: sigma-54 dependent transcriptional regulator [Desulfobacteraceae bacterium]